MARLKFHPFFVVYVFVCLYFGWLNNIFFYIVAVVLHEYGHYIATRSFGYDVEGMLFNVYGAGLKTTNIFKPKDDMVISLAGPMVNLVLILITVCFWWIFPTSYVFTLDFVKANFVVMLFNIIPIYPLDGGRVVFAIFNNKLHTKKLIKINCSICLCLGIFFILLFVISIFYGFNLSLLFTGLFLTINGMSCKKNLYYENLQSFVKDKKRAYEIKMFKVDNFDKKILIKYISPKYYSVFVKSECGKRIEMGEDELFL